jgi:hypothetical protein
MTNLNRYRFYSALFLLLAVITSACTEPSNNQKSDQPVVNIQPTANNRVPGEYLVTLTASGNPESLRSVFNAYGVKAIREFSKGRYLVVLEHDPGPEEIAERVAASTDIVRVQPNFIYHGTTPK